MLKIINFFHERIQKVLSEGSKFDNVFFYPNTTINGPSSAYQQNTIYMVFRWQADDCPTLNAVFVAL